MQWRKSSYSSETADCVEVAYPTGTPRSGFATKNVGAGHLTLSVTALHQLTQSIVGS